MAEDNRYFVNDILNKGISKTKLYSEILKTDELPISNNMVGNKRYFNDSDLAIFNHFKNYGKESAILKYGNTSKKREENSFEQSETVQKNSTPTVSNIDMSKVEELLNEKVETVIKQYESQIKSKDEIIERNDIVNNNNQTQLARFNEIKNEYKEKNRELESENKQLMKSNSNWKFSFGITITLLLVLFIIVIFLFLQNKTV